MKILNGKRIAIITLIVLVVLLTAVLLQKNERSFFYTLSAPIRTFFWNAGRGTSNFFSSIFIAGDLKRKVGDLTNQKNELLAKVAELNSLKDENDSLKKALGLDLNKEFSLTLANVGGKSIGGDFLFLDKGENDGVKKDMIVITDQKFLVGKISSVYMNYSTVELITSKNSSLDAEITDKNIQGIVKGQGNFGLLLDLIPKEKEVKDGDIVFSSGTVGVFPKGLTVGLVKSIKKGDIEAFQQAEVEPAVNFSDLQRVFLIK